MGRFWIDTADKHEEVDTYQEAWIRALELRAAGAETVTVLDKAVKVSAPAEKKNKKGKK